MTGLSAASCNRTVTPTPRAVAMQTSPVPTTHHASLAAPLIPVRLHPRYPVLHMHQFNYRDHTNDFGNILGPRHNESLVSTLTISSPPAHRQEHRQSQHFRHCKNPYRITVLLSQSVVHCHWPLHLDLHYHHRSLIAETTHGSRARACAFESRSALSYDDASITVTDYVVAPSTLTSTKS